MAKLENEEMGRQLRQPSGENGKMVAEDMNRSNLEMYQQMFSMLDLKNNEKVLEIGFGNGKFFQNYFALNPEIHVTGLDYSDLMCKEAINNNKELIEQNKLNIVHGDSLNMPFESESFDKIVTLNTLYFWEPLEQTLQSIRNVLKTNGFLLICYRPKEFIEKMPFTKEVFNLYTSEDVDNLLTNNGFSIQENVHKNYNKKNVQGDEFNMTDIFVKAIKI